VKAFHLYYRLSGSLRRVFFPPMVATRRGAIALCRKLTVADGGARVWRVSGRGGA
jgi:hypothetical protein